jgi:hypothetical protein
MIVGGVMVVLGVLCVTVFKSKFQRTVETGAVNPNEPTPIR